MARVADALKGLTAYLHSENTRLDLEFKEQKVELAAEHIATKFQQLPPDASPQMLQALQFELIGDAAALGGLQENLPLISGLHNSALQTRSITEAERHDEALAKSVEEQLGMDVGQMTGKDAMALFQAKRSAEREITSKDEAGRTQLEVLNAKNEVVFQKFIDPLTRQGALDAEFTQQSRITEMTSNFALRNALALQKSKQQFELDQLYGTTGVRQFAGMKFLRSQTTPAGDQLYEPTKGGGLYSLQEDGTLARYMENDIIPRRAGSKDITDILGGIEDARSLFGPQRFAAGNELLETQEGRDLISVMTGNEPGQSARFFQEKNKAGNYVIRQGVVQQMDTFLGQRRGPEGLQSFLSDEQRSATSMEMGAFNKFELSFRTQQSATDMLMAGIPQTKNKITSLKDWNRGHDVIEGIIMNPSIPHRQAGGVHDYVNTFLGKPTGLPVTMEEYALLPFENKQYLSSTVAAYTPVVVRMPPQKTPTIEDVTVPKKETPVTKYPNKKAPVTKNISPSLGRSDLYNKGRATTEGDFVFDAVTSFGDFFNEIEIPGL